LDYSWTTNLPLPAIFIWFNFPDSFFFPCTCATVGMRQSQGKVAK
jgi:hypothetical protein